MFAREFLDKFIDTIDVMNSGDIDETALSLLEIKQKGGRLFILGSGGSAGNASHAVNDFRKIAGIETYTPIDNVSELTAWINDKGWDFVYAKWLEESRLNKKDAVMILSVGGGSIERKLSMNLVYAAEYANKVDALVITITGRNGGEVGKLANNKIIIPNIFNNLVTPFTEAMQSVILHLLVSHHYLQESATTW